MASSVAGTGELQRFDNAERVPCDIMRNGLEHALLFANLDDELYCLSTNRNLSHATYYGSCTSRSGSIPTPFKKNNPSRLPSKHRRARGKKIQLQKDGGKN